MQLISSTIARRNPAFANAVRSSLRVRIPIVQQRGILRVLVEPRKLCRRLEVTDTKISRSSKKKEEEKRDGTDDQMSNLIDKLRVSNRATHGKFSGVSGGSRLRNVLRRSKQSETKVKVVGIDELMPETQSKKGANKKQDDMVGASSSEAMIHTVPVTSTSNDTNISLESKDKAHLSTPVKLQADHSARLRQLVSVRKTSPNIFRSSGKTTKLTEISEVLKDPSPAISSIKESSLRVATDSNKDSQTSTSSSAILGDVDVIEDSFQKSHESFFSDDTSQSATPSDPHIDLASLRKLRFKPVKELFFKRREKGAVISEGEEKSALVSDFFETEAVITETESLPNKESKSVLDDLIAAQIESTKVSQRPDLKTPASFDDDSVKDPALSQYFQDFSRDSEISSTQDFREVMKSATHKPPSTYPKMRKVTRSTLIFGSSRLNLFDATPMSPEGTKEFVSSHEKDLEQFLKTLEASNEPQNGFEAQMLTTDKVWQLPVDNEVARSDEENVGFEEHVFLEHFLDQFPSTPAVQQFMGLVINGLQQNPYLTVEQKKNRVLWFKEYFSQFSDEDLLLKVEQAVGL